MRLCDAKHHLLWCPRYRKKILVDDICKTVREIFQEIAIHFDFEIDRCELSEDHVHRLISFSSRYSVAKVLGTLMSISGSKTFQEFPKVKKKLWGGHIWEQGFFRNVGEHVIDEVIRKYIERYGFSKDHLMMFDCVF